MILNEDYYNPEEREGFYIKSMMKRYWASAIEVLIEIDRICNKYNIAYFADYGTLLGAVRHKGFVPWDDDIDICMKRIDFERFIKCAQSELIPPMQLYNVKETTIWPMRVVNNNFISMEDDFLKKFHKCPYPTGVDIFVLDNIPDDQPERDVIRNLQYAVNVLTQFSDARFSCSRLENNGVKIDFSDNDIQECVDIVESLTNITLNRDCDMTPQLSSISHIVSSSYFDVTTNEIAFVQDWSTRGELTRYAIDYSCAVMLPFEYTTVPVPIGYHSVLKRLYGEDYMTPKKFTADHAYPAYKGQETKLFNYYNNNNLVIPEYLKL